MSRRPMHDMIIVLPGIMGSVLTRHGREVWAPSLMAVTRVLQREALVRELMLDGDDPDLPFLDDGVVATRIMPDAHLIPGFWKIDGYSTLLQSLQTEFEVTVGDVYQPDPHANLFPFPYDWRRDNRATAQRLRTFVAQQLPVWRERSGHARAKVIIIAHSMGGLVARYYLEVLGGWEYCQALFTLGTPHRGSLNALNYISNGKSFFGLVDVSPALRSYTSVYQLLPIYEVIQHGDRYLRVTDVEQIEHVSRSRALAAANEFHHRIEVAASQRAASPHASAYVSVLIIGTQQLTAQSAILSGSQIRVENHLPLDLQQRHVRDFGDNTVPFYAALPPGARKNDLQPIFVPQSHSGLQQHPHVLQHLHDHLQLLQVTGSVLGTGTVAAAQPDLSVVSSGQPALRLLLDDVYTTDGGQIRVEVVDTTDPGPLTAQIEPLAGDQPVLRQSLVVRDGAWVLDLEHPQPGVYRVIIEPFQSGPRIPSAVSDIFEVIDPARG